MVDSAGDIRTRNAGTRHSQLIASVAHLRRMITPPPSHRRPRTPAAHSHPRPRPSAQAERPPPAWGGRGIGRRSSLARRSRWRAVYPCAPAHARLPFAGGWRSRWCGGVARAHTGVRPLPARIQASGGGCAAQGAGGGGEGSSGTPPRPTRPGSSPPSPGRPRPSPRDAPAPRTTRHHINTPASWSGPDRSARRARGPDRRRSESGVVIEFKLTMLVLATDGGSA